MRFCRIRKPRVQVYQASCEQIFRILAAWKCYFCRFVKPMFQGTSQRLWKFSLFLRPENAIIFFSMRYGTSIFPESRVRRFMGTYSRVRIFSAFWRTVNVICVYWRELDVLWTVFWQGLLSETGWSIDGNSLAYWRKLDGLLTETGRSIERNWMFCKMKLDGLLMETGQSIDGKNAFYWWKQTSRFS